MVLAAVPGSNLRLTVPASVRDGRPFPVEIAVTLTRFGASDPLHYFDTSCVVEAPAEVAHIPIRHATPFAAGELTAGHQVTIFCLTYPGGWPDAYTQGASVTVPERVRAGEPFPIESSGPVDVSGGIRSGGTITPTGAVGDTVEIWSDGSHTQFAPPPFPPIPLRICEQRGGPVHLASVPIVAS